MPLSTKKQQTAARKEDALAYLREVCTPGKQVLIQFLWVNRQGTNRRHSFFVAHKNEVCCINWALAEALGYKQSSGVDSPAGIETGFDGGDSLVMNLSSILYNDAYQLKTVRRQ